MNPSQTLQNAINRAVNTATTSMLRSRLAAWITYGNGKHTEPLPNTHGVNGSIGSHKHNDASMHAEFMALSRRIDVWLKGTREELA